MNPSGTHECAECQVNSVFPGNVVRMQYMQDEEQLGKKSPFLMNEVKPIQSVSFDFSDVSKEEIEEYISLAMEGRQWEKDN